MLTLIVRPAGRRSAPSAGSHHPTLPAHAKVPALTHHHPRYSTTQDGRQGRGDPWSSTATWATAVAAAWAAVADTTT
eukprot:scaffold19381_cov21-Tisochrysis_lutea.AAC.1